MSFFLFKITLTPLLIAGATLVARRWGPIVGGWFVGLPLTSGPLSFFLALEQGTEFAAASAANSLLGLCGIAIFCVIYTKSARGSAWLRSTCLALAAYFAAVELLSLPSPSLLLACIMTFGLQCATLYIVGRPVAVPVMRGAPWWDLPLRMGVAATVVLSITGFAVALGPKWSGLLAPFPAFILIMSAFSHRQYGPAAAHQLLYGAVVGTFGTISFFCIVAFSLASLGIPAAFLLAVLATFVTNGLILTLMLRRQRGH